MVEWELLPGNHGRRLVLPRAEHPNRRIVGAGFIIIGGGGAMAVILASVRFVWGGGSPGLLSNLMVFGAITLFGMIPVTVGLGFAVVGAWLLAGHSEIRLTQTHFIASEHVGPFRWSWRRALEDITAVEVKTMYEPENAWIRLQCRGGKDLDCLYMCPGEIVHAVARDITAITDPRP